MKCSDLTCLDLLEIRFAAATVHFAPIALLQKREAVFATTTKSNLLVQKRLKNVLAGAKFAGTLPLAERICGFNA